MMYHPIITTYKEEKGVDLSSENIEDKVEKIEAWLYKQKKQKIKQVLYLIAYDIEDNKIRTQIAKYLIKKGCMRIQKSVYLAKSSRTTYNEIHETLRDINTMYKNQDSIFVLPVPEEKFNNIKLIGKNIEFEIVTKEQNVLFF
jgi:CRISPR-associated endonuclease Cas2